MDFYFETDQSVAGNVRRIATEQVTMAHEFLSDPPEHDLHEGVHEARKCFKRLRGLVRMARPVLGKARYQQENHRFRDMGRLLSSVRDAQALVETFDMLNDLYGLRVAFNRMGPLRLGLVQQLENISENDELLGSRVDEVISGLEQALSAITDWPLDGARPKDLAKGTTRIYRRARKGWQKSRQIHDPALLHDWRKQVKYLRYHFQLLRGVDDDWAKPLHHGFREVSDFIGDHHDLEVLRQNIDEMKSTGLDPVAECEFRVLLREHQDYIYRRIIHDGKKLLKKKPEKFRTKVLKRLDFQS
jgi:CHAD domain-containing protein